MLMMLVIMLLRIVVFPSLPAYSRLCMREGYGYGYGFGFVSVSQLRITFEKLGYQGPVAVWW